MSDTVVSQLDRALAAARAALLQRDAAALRRLMAAYAGVEARVQARVAALTADIDAARAAGETVKPSWLMERDRLTTLRRQIIAEWARYAEQARAVITATQRAALDAATREAAQLTQAALDDAGMRGAADVARLNTRAVEEVVGVLADGSPLAELLARVGAQAAADVSAALTHAVATGRNPRQTARDIRAALGGGLHRALRIARTEHLRAYRNASLQTYQANADILRGWQWRASPSRRTCPVCLAMDGREFGLNEPFASHISCRCTPVPLLKDRALPPRETGAAWFARQPEAAQRAILGPAKFDLYQRGRITLNDLVGVRDDPRWGRAVYERGVGELESNRDKPAGRPTQAPPKPPATTPAASARERLEHVAKRTKAKQADLKQDIAALVQERDELERTKFVAPTQAERTAARVRLNEVKTRLQRAREHYDKLDAEYPELLREQLYTRNPARVQAFITQGVPDTQRPEIEKAIRAFERMVEHKTTQLTVETTVNNSYYVVGTNAFRLRNTADAATVIHEMGHWLEDINPTVRDAARAFLDRRTAGEKDIPLYQYNPKYLNEPKKVTRPDQFRDYYVGRQYRNAAGEYTGTEVLSMGLEWFYSDPLGFARDDPDMFDFIYTIVRMP